MKICLKLFATLGEYLPAGAVRNRIDIEVAPTDSIHTILERYHVPLKIVHLVLVNGHYIQPADRASRCLQENDELAIWPPIAGG